MKNATQYKVTVTAVIERKEISGNTWTTVAQEFKSGHPDTPVSVYGYTPEIEKTVVKEVPVFEQTVEALDLASLVMVVNGIKP